MNKKDIKRIIKEELENTLGSKPRYKIQMKPEPTTTRPNKINRHSSWVNRWNGQRIRTRSNSVWDIVDFLKNNPGSTENEIHSGAFGFDRGSSFESNKKYAELLRRAVDRGLILRGEKIQGPGRHTYVYFLPGQKQG